MIKFNIFKNSVWTKIFFSGGGGSTLFVIVITLEWPVILVYKHYPTDNFVKLLVSYTPQHRVTFMLCNWHIIHYITCIELLYFRKKIHKICTDSHAYNLLGSNNYKFKLIADLIEWLLCSVIDTLFTILHA